MNPVEYALAVSGWMTEPETSWLHRTAAALKPGAVWLEVGTWMGRSWSCVALSLPESSTIISVDSFRGELAEPLVYVQTHGPVLNDFMRVHEDVRRLRPDLASHILASLSVPAARLVADRSCDVVFIDGNHTHEAVANDLRAWIPKLKPGGLMCGHDISEPGVRLALKEYVHSYNPHASGSIWWLK